MASFSSSKLGVLPNPIMPNTFLAQAFDLDDPWGDKTCYGFGCCNPYEGPNMEECTALHCNVPNTTVAAGAACLKARCPGPFNSTNCVNSLAKVALPATGCDDYCAALHGTPVYMGGIHPRLKRPVGERLAIAAYVRTAQSLRIENSSTRPGVHLYFLDETRDIIALHCVQKPTGNPPNDDKCFPPPRLLRMKPGSLEL